MTGEEKRRRKRIRRRAKADAAAFLKERRGYRSKAEKKAFRIAARERARYRAEALQTADPMSAEELKLYNRAFTLRVNRLGLLMIAAGLAVMIAAGLLLLL